MRARRYRSLCSFLVAAAVVIAAVGRIAAQPNAPPNGCELILPGSDAATSRNCLACHESLAHGSHPADIDYPRAVPTKGAAALRPLTEARRRGVFLPNGRVECVTCHAGTSPWRYHIRLPAGSKVVPAVDFRRPVTYENPDSLPPPHAGEDVGRKPLCLGCHALD